MCDIDVLKSCNTGTNSHSELVSLSNSDTFFFKVKKNRHLWNCRRNSLSTQILLDCNFGDAKKEKKKKRKKEKKKKRKKEKKEK
jgi:hypothetical protein